MYKVDAIERLEREERMRIYEQINENMDKELEALRKEEERIANDYKLNRGRFASTLEKLS